MEGLKDCVEDAFAESSGTYLSFEAACIQGLQTTELSSRKKENVVVLFEESKNGVVYRGFLRAAYMLYRGGLGGAKQEDGFKTLYVTHAAVYPTGGKIVSDGLLGLLRTPLQLDAVYIEAILDDAVVLPYFEKEGWTKTNPFSADVFVLRNSPAVSRRYRQRVAIPRFLSLRPF